MRLATALLICSATVHAASTNHNHIAAAERSFHEGIVAAATGKIDQAFAAFRSAVEIEPTYLEALNQWARTALAVNRTDEAGRVLTQLLQIDPQSDEHRILLGNLLLKQGQTSRALAQFSIALSQHPESADALYGFATAAQSMGMQEKASAALARGRREHAEDPRFAVAETKGSSQ